MREEMEESAQPLDLAGNTIKSDAIEVAPAPRLELQFVHPSDPVKPPAWLSMCGSGYIPMFLGASFPTSIDGGQTIFFLRLHA
jgi:hypothetical protein